MDAAIEFMAEVWWHARGEEWPKPRAGDTFRGFEVVRATDLTGDRVLCWLRGEGEPFALAVVEGEAPCPR